MRLVRGLPFEGHVGAEGWSQHQHIQAGTLNGLVMTLGPQKKNHSLRDYGGHWSFRVWGVISDQPGSCRILPLGEGKSDDSLGLNLFLPLHLQHTAEPMLFSPPHPPQCVCFDFVFVSGVNSDVSFSLNCKEQSPDNLNLCV